MKNRKAYHKKYRQEHFEKIKTYNKKWREEHPKNVKAMAKKNYEKHKDYYKKYNFSKKMQTYHKKYRQEYQEEMKIYAKEWYQKNKEKRLLQIKKYKQEHINERRIRDAKYVAIKRKIDINFRIASIFRSRINQVLKSQSAIKYNKSNELLGTTISEVRSHLENQFKLGMNWGNWSYYGWHIDHIKPLTSFDLTNPEEQKKAFHYTNLQPLWARENLSKSDKYVRTQ